MNQEEKFEAWIRSEVVRSKAPGERFVLRSAAPGSRGAEIETFEIEERLELEELPTFAANILARAQEDADSNGSRVNRYVVQSYRKGDERKAGARYSFRLRGASDPDLDDEAGEEPANQRGLLSQLMRHNEAMMRMLVTSTGSSVAGMSRRMESQDRTMEKLLHERNEYQRIVEDARSEQHGRDIEAAVTDASIRRKDEAFAKLMALLPIVINKIAGGKVLPDKSDPLMMLLEPLISSLDSEQFKAISSTLNPQQSIMFVELLQAFQKRKQLATGEKEKPS